MQVKSWIEERVDSVVTAVMSANTKLLQPIDDFLGTKLVNYYKSLAGLIYKVDERLLDPFINDLRLNPATPEMVKKLLTTYDEAGAGLRFILGAPLVITHAITFLRAAYLGEMQRAVQAGLKHIQPSILTANEAIAAMWRGEITEDEFIDNMERLGYDASMQDTLEHISRFIPQIGDLIRFTVRDVFNPDVVKKYGYDTGFDEISGQLKPHLDKIGVDLETLRLYWRSHWELPSVSMAYEMLHRGLISEDDIRVLLRINDVAPTWIEPIVKASYSNYTRVDVRRMYIAGVLDEDEVKRSYLDLGYNDDKAENMTAWTITEAMSSERDLSKAEIINAYGAAVISDSETKTMLESLGYSEDETEIILSLAEYKIENAISKREKRVLSTQYVNGRINALEFQEGLEALKVNKRELELLTDEADARIKEKHKYPSKSDLDKWLKAGIIEKGEYRAEMSYIGYSEYHIGKYLEMV